MAIVAETKADLGDDQRLRLIANAELVGEAHCGMALPGGQPTVLPPEVAQAIGNTVASSGRRFTEALTAGLSGKRSEQQGREERR
jgi:hypothetical protein